MGPTGGGRSRTLAAVALVVTATAVVVAGCGRDDEARFDAASERAATSSSTSSTAPGTWDGTGEPSDGGSTAPPTTASAAADPGAALLAAVAAFEAELGPVRALQLTAHFPTTGGPYASLQSQDPATPANVDERDWRDGKLSSPSPVRLFPGTDLAAELFDLSAVDWPAVAAALPSAPALVEQALGTAFENSDGVTHVIAESDLPFSPDTVVRVYVDGGDRTTGGYVELRTDGTVGAVMA